jgi:hypothetical protein
LFLLCFSDKTGIPGGVSLHGLSRLAGLRRLWRCMVEAIVEKSVGFATRRRADKVRTQKYAIPWQSAHECDLMSAWHL